jgi:hypothetical protein
MDFDDKELSEEGLETAGGGEAEEEEELDDFGEEEEGETF